MFISRATGTDINQLDGLLPSGQAPAQLQQLRLKLVELMVETVLQQAAGWVTGRRYKTTSAAVIQN